MIFNSFQEPVAESKDITRIVPPGLCLNGSRQESRQRHRHRFSVFKLSSSDIGLPLWSVNSSFIVSPSSRAPHVVSLLQRIIMALEGAHQCVRVSTLPPRGIRELPRR
jgi:hypothetical protein